MIFLRMATWQAVREDFSEPEKQVINAAITGETICPAGCTLDVGKLGPDLVAKIKAAQAKS